MAGVTPCISYFRTTQNLGRVPTNMFQTRPSHIAAGQEIRTYLQHLALYTHTPTHTHPDHSVFPSLLRYADDFHGATNTPHRTPGFGGLRPAVARQNQQHPRDSGGPQLRVLAINSPRGHYLQTVHAFGSSLH